MLIGKLEINKNAIEFNTDENNNFLNSKEALENLAVWINSPWSQTNEKYIIKYNCKDSYTTKDPAVPDWICSYEIIGYDAIKSTLYGYGSSPEESLKNCMELFKKLQKEYNIENEHV